MRILLVGMFPPSPGGDSGGARSLAWHAEALSREFDVRILHLGGPPVSDVRGVPSTGVAPDPRGTRRRVRLAWGLARGDPGYVAGNRSRQMVLGLEDLVSTWQPDVIQFEHSAAVQWARPYARLARDRRPALILVDHDAREAATRRHRDPERARSLRQALEARGWRRWSTVAPSLVDTVVVFTADDRDAVLAARPGTRVEVIAPAGPPPALPAPATAPHDPRLVLFVGNYSHGPNVDAARRLTRAILPAVRERVGDARLVIAGRGDPGVRTDPLGGVEVAGYVADIDALRRRAAVEVCPVRLGGGVRVQVIEALGAGRAMVASPRAIEGLGLTGGRELEVATDDRGFADAVAGLLLDPARRRALGEAATRWAATGRSWPDFCAAYRRLYASLGVDTAEDGRQLDHRAGQF